MSKNRPSIEDQVSSVVEDEVVIPRVEFASAQPAPVQASAPPPNPAPVPAPVTQMTPQGVATRNRQRSVEKGSSLSVAVPISSSAHLAQVKADREEWLGGKVQLGARVFKKVKEAFEDEYTLLKRSGVDISKEEFLNDILIERFKIVYPG